MCHYHDPNLDHIAEAQAAFVIASGSYLAARAGKSFDDYYSEHGGSVQQMIRLAWTYATAAPDAPIVGDYVRATSVAFNTLSREAGFATAAEHLNISRLTRSDLLGYAMLIATRALLCPEAQDVMGLYQNSDLRVAPY
jgi:hypothetical protein